MQEKVVKGDLRDIKLFEWVIVPVQGIIESSLRITFCKKEQYLHLIFKTRASPLQSKHNKVAFSELGTLLAELKNFNEGSS